jgi:ABC-type transport system substrate-binding protein
MTTANIARLRPPRAPAVRSGSAGRVRRALVAAAGAILVSAIVAPGSRAQVPAASALTVAQPGPVPGLDPAAAPAWSVYPSESEAAFLVYDGLVRLNEELRIVPQLATSRSVAADGRTWTLRLRPGVRFQDGTPLTGGAVAEDLRRQLDPSAHPSNRLLWDAIASVSAPRDGAVEIVTREPYAALLHLLAHASALLPSPPAVRRLGAQYRWHPVGTGAYSVDRWDPGRDLQLLRNDRYWAGAPAFVVMPMELGVMPRRVIVRC